MVFNCIIDSVGWGFQTGLSFIGRLLVPGTVLNILTYGIVFTPQSNPMMSDVVIFYT